MKIDGSQNYSLWFRRACTETTLPPDTTFPYRKPQNNARCTVFRNYMLISKEEVPSLTCTCLNMALRWRIVRFQVKSVLKASLLLILVYKVSDFDTETWHCQLWHLCTTVITAHSRYNEPTRHRTEWEVLKNFLSLCWTPLILVSWSLWVMSWPTLAAAILTVAVQDSANY